MEVLTRSKCERALRHVAVARVIGLGSEARMNLPGSATGSWRWRMAPGALTPALAAQLREATAEAGRLAG